ncbi:MAG: ABC transporter permease, partial [Chloroflexi bacterium]|nr:ABC transporter permease [Chloroflexota bacterium]
TSIAVLIVVSAFGLIHSPWALLVLPLALLTGLMFASIALFFTSVAPSIYSFNYYFTLFITPMFFFSGVFFPLDSFPEAVQRLAWISPLTSATDLTRAIVSGDPASGAWWSLGIVFGLTAVFLPLALFMMRRRLLK